MSQFKISTIIPVYNVDKYLDDTILSIVNQTIGFKSIQLILVNDGSTDNSEEICLKYQKQYPDNVIYIKQGNSGVSHARNNGFKYALGEYVHYMDSDDLISLTAYETGYNTLKKNNVDVVCFRIKMFDAVNEMHTMDYRFQEGDKIVDLHDNPFFPLYHMPTAIIKKELLLDMKLDTRLKVSEDLKYMSELMAKTRYLGIISSELYYYRRRSDGSSTIQTSNKNYSFFFDTPVLSYDYVLNLRSIYNNMHDYLTNVIVSDLKWRIFGCDLSLLSYDERIKYKDLIKSILLKCDDKIICNQKPYNFQIVFGELYFKYGKDVYKRISCKNGDLFFDNYKLTSINNFELRIVNLSITNDLLCIDGFLSSVFDNNFEIFAKVDDKFLKFTRVTVRESERDLYMINSEVNSVYYSIDNINLNGVKKIEFYIEIDGCKEKMCFNFEKFSKLNNLKNSFYKKNHYVLKHNNNEILVKNKIGISLFNYLFELLFVKKDILSFGIIILYYMTYPFFRHDYWIIADREDAAGDNGEALLDYISLQDKNRKNICFALKKGSGDVKRIKSKSKVIYFKSIKFYLIYLNSQLVLSSHFDNYIRQPFGRKQIYLNYLLNNKFIFLQHGIIKDDLSSWLKKYNMNISLFITSTQEEYKLILNGNYMYDKSVVKLTGMPRFDKLLSNDVEKENIILLCPTWRAKLAGPTIPGTQFRPYNSQFKNSDYYKYYNDLITDKRLIKLLKDYNFKLVFCLHPSFKSQVNDFEGCEFVSIKTLVDYSYYVKKSKIMITDYSSVVCDFAYLKKPIIYSQFDADVFSLNHTYASKSKYNYLKQGFGEVVYTIDDTIDIIEKTLKYGCKMENKYLSRVNRYFKYKDNKNCERVYNEIKKMLDGDRDE